MPAYGKYAFSSTDQASKRDHSPYGYGILIGASIAPHENCRQILERFAADVVDIVAGEALEKSLFQSLATSLMYLSIVSLCARSHAIREPPTSR